MAQQLVAMGETVGLLGLVDTSAEFGVRYRDEARRGLSARVQRLHRRMQGQSFGQRLSTLGEVINGRRQARQMQQKAQLARREGGELPHDVRYAELQAAHFRAYVDYVVLPHPGRIVLFRAAEQPVELRDKPMLGWENLVDAVDVVSIPGDHRGLIETPALVAALARAVLQAQGLPAGEDAAAQADAVALDGSDPRVGYLRQVWKELLSTDVGADDNFFSLGGNSMLAVQMSSRVARETGARIPLMRLTVQTLAQVAAELPAAGANSSGDGMNARMARRIRRLLRVDGEKA